MNTSLFRHGVLAADLEAVDGLGGVLPAGPVGVAWEFLCFCFLV